MKIIWGADYANLCDKSKQGTDGEMFGCTSSFFRESCCFLQSDVIFSENMRNNSHHFEKSDASTLLFKAFIRLRLECASI